MNLKVQNSAIAAAALVASAGLLIAGPLNPPAGPVAPTYKTLQQVEPRTDVATLPGNSDAAFVIAQPGSYYLTGNLAAVMTSTVFEGILITASDVTLDLNGFMLQKAGASGGNIGIKAGPSVTRLAIRNGSIEGFIVAVDAHTTASARVNGIVADPSSDGISVGPNSLVSQCAMRRVSGGYMYILGTGSRAEDCVADGGQRGFVLADAASLVRCSSVNATGAGISTANDALILDCNVAFTPTGIDLQGGGNRVERCKLGNVGNGIEVSTANSIIGNSLNAAANGVGIGIHITGNDNHVEGNHVYTFAAGATIDAVSNTVIRNTFQFGLTAVNGSAAGSPQVIAPVVTNTAGLAANATANISQ